MCESKVFSSGGELIMEDVVRIRVEKDFVKFWDILGSYREIRGRILEIDLLTHKLVVEVL
ncbi:MAG: CooT family nickel-binding protein [Archaeoglobaceae archaeon]|nr:CooT family nickel-binding protein [Archaeoglobaceae archaeon]